MVVIKFLIDVIDGLVVVLLGFLDKGWISVLAEELAVNFEYLV